MTPQLLDSHTEIATTGHGMFGFYDEEGTYPQPPPRRGDEWCTASSGAVHIYPACQHPAPAIRFERWDQLPSHDVYDNLDLPEVAVTLPFEINGEGSLGLMAVAAGAEPGVFGIPPGRYHLQLLGYQRSLAATRERDLQARNADDGEWEQAQSAELYVARFWPTPAESIAQPQTPTHAATNRYIEIVHAWARSQGIPIDDNTGDAWQAAHAADIRAWYEGQGVPINEFGRIPGHRVDRYVAEVYPAKGQE
ncbi:hypothetical protein ACSNOI_03895 [Actinomadura kijaniata]|uniref:hypothetical protein n=1 Tax=Actinomadura kijaniata TaxID=46161 RepID=UPI003F1A929B